MISHDLPFVRDRADRVVLMENGAVQASGAPASVFATDAFRRVFPVEAEKGADQ